MKANENDIFEAVYRAGEEEGLRSYKKEMRDRIEQAIAEEEAIKHLFTIQRILGLGLMLCAFVIGAAFSEWFVTLVLFPIATALLLSNHLIITEPGEEYYDA